ncbi:hypothetical protein PFICI_08451 [Pestalotiopsis fici W106-1]|uniref:Uncharacterized protein n=1 Tax=Pestalotiopsis fici (strain W106-1 / CGMCC3.15140) TaxID=1229662 RepID=W3X6A8_PESFW|nr:uncharacterized protein PFICI_08451 [Pestalotiopsis fici W106-1]ETS80922.1 hypothetical protein PFICI_08451 [Pestalotiopsis fici W106-1]
MDDQHEENKKLSTCHVNSPVPLSDLQPHCPALFKIRRRRPQLLGCHDQEAARSISCEAAPIGSFSTTRGSASQTCDGTETCAVETKRLGAADACLDGAQSSSSTSGSEASDNDADPHDGANNKTPNTVPRDIGLRPSMLTAFWSDSKINRRRNRRQALTEGSPLSRGGFTRLSDRFVPSREPSSLIADRFRTVKDSHRLSTSERIVRNEAALPDPFISRSQRFAAARTIPRGSHSDGSDRRNGEPND